MSPSRALKIGITCYPSVGGSGILASALGEELAKRGHDVHFISYERPVRMPTHGQRLHFHPVSINDYGLFRYPDYTLPLSVKMAEVSRDHGLDVLHVHYAVPHATAAILARSMLPAAQRPRVVTTLHGTDTTLLGRDEGYRPAIRHALMQSDAVTTVSDWLRDETRKLFEFDKPIEVIHNFYAPREPRRSKADVRKELGVKGREALVLHASNLRAVKRIDLLLEAAGRIKPRSSFKLAILAGGDFSPFKEQVRRLGLEKNIVVVEKATHVEDYLHAGDLALFSSESESFCLSMLEAMWFGIPSVTTAVGGIPEVAENGKSGVLVPAGDADALARGVEELIANKAARVAMGKAAQARARERFTADQIVPHYEQLYRRVVAGVRL